MMKLDKIVIICIAIIGMFVGGFLWELYDEDPIKVKTVKVKTPEENIEVSGEGVATKVDSSSLDSLFFRETSFTEIVSEIDHTNNNQNIPDSNVKPDSVNIDDYWYHERDTFEEGSHSGVIDIWFNTYTKRVRYKQEFRKQEEVLEVAVDDLLLPDNSKTNSRDSPRFLSAIIFGLGYGTKFEDSSKFLTAKVSLEIFEKMQLEGEISPYWYKIAIETRFSLGGH